MLRKKPKKPKKPKSVDEPNRSVVLVCLTIDGDPDHAYSVVNTMLDAGEAQDPINHCSDELGCKPLHVRVASIITPTRRQHRAAMLAAEDLDGHDRDLAEEHE